MARKRQRGGRTYYVARFTFPKDPLTGRRSAAKEFWATSLKDANRLRDAYREEYNRNPSADRVTTFGTYLESDFIPFEEARYKIGELTWGRYQERKSRLKRFVLEHPKGKALVAAPLAKLSPGMFERFFDDLLKAGIGANRRNMIRRDLILALRKTRRALSYPATEFFIDIPQAREEKKIKKVFAAADIEARIADESLPLESRAIVAFEYILLCRPGEMFPLRWSDIDWKTERVAINKAVRKDQHGYTLRENTKTGRKGDRTLPLGSVLAPMLRRIQKERMKRGVASDYVFCQPDGAPYDKDSFRYAWKRIRIELKLPEGPTFYSLKTLGNVEKRRKGVPAPTRAKLMGHTTTRMAENDYSVTDDAEIAEAIEVHGSRLNRTG